MRFHRPARRIALGLGAAGIALGSRGLAIAATALIQPAGALSVQVPAVAVREQNVNAAGRIRVALPKTSVGVNGSVNVSNLPVTSAGRLQTQNGTGQPHQAGVGPWVVIPYGQSVTVLDVAGSGTFTGLRAVSNPNSASGYTDGLVTVTIDGQIAFQNNISAGAIWSPGGGDLRGGVLGGGNIFAMQYDPPIPLSYHKSLVVTISAATHRSSGANMFWADVWYTTGG